MIAHQEDNALEVIQRVANHGLGVRGRYLGKRGSNRSEIMSILRHRSVWIDRARGSGKPNATSNSENRGDMG
jgi:hypothetical protein